MHCHDHGDVIDKGHPGSLLVGKSGGAKRATYSLSLSLSLSYIRSPESSFCLSSLVSRLVVPSHLSVLRSREDEDVLEGNRWVDFIKFQETQSGNLLIVETDESGYLTRL